MERHRVGSSSRIVFVAAGLAALAASVAQGWMRPGVEDAVLVRRSELIVVGHLDKDSIKLVPHPHPPGEGASWEHHATLIVTEILKGDVDESIPIVLHYGLTPIVGGYYDKPGMMINRRLGRPDYPRDVLEIYDSGSRGGVLPIKDAGQDNLWFLRRRAGTYGREPGTGNYGIVDPQDLQPLSLKGYFAAYMDPDTERAVRREVELHPEVAQRAQAYFDHREVRRLSRIADPTRRAEALIPYFLKGMHWDNKREARDHLLACADVAAPRLLAPFRAPEPANRRREIIAYWGETRWVGGVPVLVDLLREQDAFWAGQRLEKGWWSRDPESALTRRRRDAYGEVYSSVSALAQIGDPRAREAVEATRRRWLAIGFDNPQIVASCNWALKVFDEPPNR